MPDLPITGLTTTTSTDSGDLFPIVEVSSGVTKKQTRATLGASLSSILISDTVYGVGWNGITTIAPSKNAVYDKVELLDAAKLNLTGGTLSGGILFSTNNTGLTWTAGTTLKEIAGILTLTSAGGFSVAAEIYAFETIYFQGTGKGFNWTAGHTLLDDGGDLEITTAGDCRYNADLHEFVTGAVKITTLTASTLAYLNASKEFVSLANSAGLLLNDGSGSLSYTLLTGDGSVDSSGVFTAANTVKPTRALVSGSNVTNATTTLADITGLTVSLAVNSVYEIEAHLVLGTSADTDGTGYAIQYSAAGATVEAGFIGSANGVSGAKTLRINAFNTSTVACMVTNAQTGVATIKGIVRTGANAGNLTVQHKKFVAGTSTVYIDSFLKVTKIG
jgi:hypothetical protein